MSRMLECDDTGEHGHSFLTPPSPISEIQGGPHSLLESDADHDMDESRDHSYAQSSVAGLDDLDDLRVHDDEAEEESDAHLERESVYIGLPEDEQELSDEDEEDDLDDAELSDPERARAPPLPLEHIYVQDPRQPLLLSDFDVIKTLGTSPFPSPFVITC